MKIKQVIIVIHKMILLKSIQIILFLKQILIRDFSTQTIPQSFPHFQYSLGGGSSSMYIFSEFAQETVPRTAWRSKLVERARVHTSQITCHL